MVKYFFAFPESVSQREKNFTGKKIRTFCMCFDGFQKFLRLIAVTFKLFCCLYETLTEKSLLCNWSIFFDDHYSVDSLFRLLL
jgi:hypothetical protein